VRLVDYLKRKLPILFALRYKKHTSFLNPNRLTTITDTKLLQQNISALHREEIPFPPFTLLVVVTTDHDCLMRCTSPLPSTAVLHLEEAIIATPLRAT